MNNQHQQDEVNNDKEMQEQKGNLNEHADTGTGEPQESEENPIQQLESQLQECNDKYLRLAAEFDNFRKRSMKDRLDLIRNASEDVIKSLLEVLDDVDRASQQIESSEDTEQLKAGITLIFGKLKSTLQQKGLQEMEAAGMEFDPEMHEAIAEIPAASEDTSGKIMDVVAKGYLLNDKIIRHAKVVVGK